MSLLLSWDDSVALVHLFLSSPLVRNRQPLRAAAAGGNGVVDLTGSVKEEDVQLLSHAQNSIAYEEYNPFNPPAGGEDAYMAAYRAASASTDASPVQPSGPQPLSVDQMASLSKEQQAVVMAIMDGQNVFFSGCAGTGKSHLLKLMAQFLPRSSTFFTASTGLAAVNIGGTTVHRSAQSK